MQNEKGAALEPARPEELETCYAIIDSGREFQKEQGFVQWTEDYPSREIILDDIERGKQRGGWQLICVLILTESLPTGRSKERGGAKSPTRRFTAWRLPGNSGAKDWQTLYSGWLESCVWRRASAICGRIRIIRMNACSMS